jgi:DNA-binding transcriptional LysR family regulator
VNARQPIRDTEIDIRSLRTFVAVAEELSFTRAAERLFVAQQAVSRTIRDLEAQLATQLFVRSTRHVALTADGQRLLARARELIALHDRIVDDLGVSSRPVVIDLLSEGRLTGPRILEATRAAAPEREFRGRYGHGIGEAIRLLTTGELDAALGRADWVGRSGPGSITSELVRWEPLAVMLPATHQLASLDAVPVSALAGVEIDTNPGNPDAPEWSDLADQFLALSGAVATPPHLAATGLENQADHLIRQGIPILTGADHLAVPGGVVRQLVDPVAVYPWSIIWRRGAEGGAVSAIRTAAAALAAEHGWLTLPEDAWLPEPEASASLTAARAERP